MIQDRWARSFKQHDALDQLTALATQRRTRVPKIADVTTAMSFDI